jgi:tyrosine-protein kinase
LTASPPRDVITPQRVASIVWRRKLVCLVVAAIVVAVGGGLLLTRPKVYQSTASVALLPVPTNSGALPSYPNLVSSLIPTYVQLVSSPVLLNRVAARLPFGITETELANDVHAESLSNAAVIDIVAQNPDPVRAQQIAARTTAEFLAQLRGNGVVVPQIYGQPTAPGQPVGSGATLALGVVLALAIILGLAAGLVWDRLLGGEDAATRPSPAAQAAAQRAAPPLLGIVSDPGGQGAGQAGAAPVHGAPGTATAPSGTPGTAASRETSRALRTNFMYATADRPAHSVMISSLGPGEGATTVAVNLASSVAELGLAVVLVDANLRHPMIHELLGLDNGEGLTSAALAGADPASLLRPVSSAEGLQVITAGPPLQASQDEPSLYLQQLPKFTCLADLVIVDGPHLQAGAYAAVAARATDGVLLVMRSGARNLASVEGALRILQSGAPLLGTVLTRAGHVTNGAGPHADTGNVRVIRGGGSG